MASKQQQERQRGNRAENRHERRQQQHSGGGDFDCIIKPEGLETWKPEAKETYHIDVLPYIVGKYNKNADPGDEYFELSYPCYNNLGIDEKRFVAIGELLGVRDPIAEHFATLRKVGEEWDNMKGFKPKWRQLMLVFVHEQAEKGLQLFEGAYGTFGELLDEEIHAGQEDWIDNFDDPDHGATLEVRFTSKNIGAKNPWILAGKINFMERDGGFNADGNKKLAAEILQQVSEICLDDCLKITDYATLKAALDGVPSSVDEDDDPKPRTEQKTGKAKPKFVDPRDNVEELEEEPNPKPKVSKPKQQPTAESLGITKGGTVEHETFGTCTVVRIAADGLSVVIMDADDSVHPGIDPTDLEPKAEEEAKPKKEENPTPAPSVAKGGSSKKKDAPTAETKSPSKGGKDAGWDDDWED